MNTISIRGARTHNLKNIDVTLPRDKLIVITGLSGSGKSSLAFDTLYAEGQRRYVESLSAYARQFLSLMEKPDVDHIEGLSPAISIEQKSTSHNPRSTVGTITEIYDYLRLLFARVGQPHCPTHNTVLEAKTVSQMVDEILALPQDTKIMLLAPVIRERKGEYIELFKNLHAQGYIRARVNGEVIEVESPPTLYRYKKHTIEVVIDRFKIRPDIQTRLAESLETALKLSQGLAIAVDLDDAKKSWEFSANYACSECGYSLKELEPRLFSFNSPAGACPTCDGLGIQPHIDMERLPDYIKRRGHFLPKFASKTEMARYLEKRYKETDSQMIREELHELMIEQPCPECDGSRLCLSARHVLIGKHNLPKIARLSIQDACDYFKSLTLKGNKAKIAEKILKEIIERLNFLVNVGLDYLSLERSAETLSGGEAQRIRLASQIGAGLVGVMYVLDEPSIGLHQRDNQRLLKTLFHLRDLGNTVIVVEHDEDAILHADHVLDIGPGAGTHGGTIVAQGTPKEIMKAPASLTGQYLSKKLEIEIPKKRLKPSDKKLTIQNASGNNLKNITVDIPIGLMTCVTGVSGSGKSTLINDTLMPVASTELNGATTLKSAPVKAIKGLEHLDKIVDIDQSPIGRTPRSNPSTYTGMFTNIRELFAATPESRARGYQVGRFSFNVKGGRCEACEGDGVIKVEMHFLPDVYVICDHCKGKRYNRETLEIKYKNKSIDEVLNMTVEEALEFFKAVPSIFNKVKTLMDVGLSYIQLGQRATTLSGGEAQRIKLAKELSRRDTGKTLYILDEPTTGLHFHDVKQLLKVLHHLRDKGNTLIIIEHNLDVIKTADWIIDLGPEGGHKGGTVLATGTPETVAKNKASYTGQFLKPILS